MIDELALTGLDRRILNRIQLGFPLSEDPYGELAGQIGEARAEVYRAVCALRESGIIRRIGASYVPKQLGYTTTLVAAQVEPGTIEQAAAVANRHPEVTHNYERDNRFNLWFTVIAPSSERLLEIVSQVGEAPGVEAIHALPSSGTFKLKVEFRFEEPGGITECESSASSGEAKPVAGAPLPVHKPLIARTCGNIDDSLDPFGSLAAEVGLSRDDALGFLRNYRERGLLRRFGAILRHQAAGFVANGMTIWNVPPARLEETGRLFASQPDISHCYRRDPAPGWPYNLYAMAHRQSRDEVRILCRTLAKAARIDDYCILFSMREFKKTSMVYFADHA